MAQLIILREKSMSGMLVSMNCYVNDRIVCKVKNGEQATCEVPDAVVGFKCNLSGNFMSNTVYLDLTDGKSVNIRVKQGAITPSVNIMDRSAIAVQGSSDVHIAAAKPNTLRTALHNAQKSLDIYNVGMSNYSTFSPTREVGNYFAIDENSHLWAISKGVFSSLKNATPYSYDDIIDFELIEDGNSIVKGGIGSAFVGGLLFGSVGAIVGSVSGKKTVKQTCTSLIIKITVNNIDAPVEYIKLISSNTNKNSFVYRNAYQDAQEIISLLQLICNQRNTSNSESHNSVSQYSTADEIRKYKELWDDGIITEEEFQAKKKQLLGL